MYLRSPSFNLFAVAVFVSLVVLVITVWVIKQESIQPLCQAGSDTATNPTTLIPKTFNNSDDEEERLHVFYIHQWDGEDKLNKGNFAFFMNFAYIPCSSKVFFTILLTHDKLNISENHANPNEFHKRVKHYLKKLDYTKKFGEILGTEKANKLMKCINTGDKVDGNFSSANTKIYLLKNQLGSDLCAYKNLLNSDYWKLNQHLFAYFFFINSSVRGPFLPLYYFKPWWDMFIDMFKYYPGDTVAVGPFLACRPRIHLQSFLLCVNRRGLDILNNVFRCRKPDEDWYDWIQQTEVQVGSDWLLSNQSIRSLIFNYGGMGSQDEIDKFCAFDEFPVLKYPLQDQEFASILYAENNFKPREEDFAVNVFETGWVKYNNKVLDMLTNYTKMYVPMYTSLMYQNARRGFMGRVSP